MAPGSSLRPPTRSSLNGVVEERDLREEFERHYSNVTAPAMRRAERQVIGTDFGATSFTTTDQADDLAALLGLSEQLQVLDIGSGTGWPGIYLALTTGCRMTLTDIPFQGLQVATARIAIELLGHQVSVVAAYGGALPFRQDTFDAVISSDAFC